MNQIFVSVAQHAPAIIAAAGARTSYRFFEFFIAQLRNSKHASRAVRLGIRWVPVRCL